MENFTNQGFETVQKPVHVDMLTYSGSAFGSTPDGDQVFINARIVEALNLSEGMVLLGHLLPNFPDKRDQIQWRAMRMQKPTDREPIVEDDEPFVEAEETPGQKILARIRSIEEGYFTTLDLVRELKLDTKTVNNNCMSLHNRGLIARADVHAAPNQKRASFVLWAPDAKSFAS